MTRVMTKLLERAIAKVRALPESEQDEAAEALDEFVREAEAVRTGKYQLSDDERAAIRESKAQARRVCERRGHGRILETPWAMRVRYTLGARADLDAIHAYLNERNPHAAQR